MKQLVVFLDFYGSTPNSFSGYIQSCLPCPQSPLSLCVYTQAGAHMQARTEFLGEGRDLQSKQNTQEQQQEVKQKLEARRE